MCGRQCEARKRRVLIHVTHKIAGIIFHTDSNVWLPRLQDEPFEQFRVRDSCEPNVRQHLRIIDINSKTLLPPSQTDEICSSHDRYLPETQNSPLLYSHEVRMKLCAYIERPEQVSVRIERDQVNIQDYGAREANRFCLPKVGKYDASMHIASNFPQLFCAFLPAFSAMPIHCAGVIRNNKAIIFLAPDEGGKTTVMSLAGNVPVLHDDIVIWKTEGRRVVAYATPFGKNTSGPGEAPIRALFLLEQAPSFELIPVSWVDLVQSIWTAHLEYSNALPKEFKARAFDVVYNACRQASTFRMRFPKDDVEWDAIDAAIA